MAHSLLRFVSGLIDSNLLGGSLQYLDYFLNSNVYSRVSISAASPGWTRTILDGLLVTLHSVKIS